MWFLNDSTFLPHPGGKEYVSSSLSWNGSWMASGRQSVVRGRSLQAQLRRTRPPGAQQRHPKEGRPARRGAPCPPPLATKTSPGRRTQHQGPVVNDWRVAFAWRAPAKAPRGPRGVWCRRRRPRRSKVLLFLLRPLRIISDISRVEDASIGRVELAQSLHELASLLRRDNYPWPAWVSLPTEPNQLPAPVLLVTSPPPFQTGSEIARALGTNMRI